MFQNSCICCAESVYFVTDANCANHIMLLWLCRCCVNRDTSAYQEQQPKMSKVSVIVPNYNHARYLPKRIESILRQSYQDFELILLDDCSTDDSRAVLSQYADDPRVRIEFNDVNSGSPFKQWNKGVSLARGEYVWIAESDDYADERLLQRLIPVLEENAAITLAYCRSWSVSEDGENRRFGDTYLNLMSGGRWNSDFYADGLEECRRYLVFTNSIPNASAVLFRKAAYDSAGGADEGYRVCGDWKLWATMASAGKIAYVAEPLNYFRFHEDSARRRSDRERWGAAEFVCLMRWLVDTFDPGPAALVEVRHRCASLWVPAVMSPHVPPRRKLLMLRDASAIDPHLIRSAVRPALTSIRLKFRKHWRSSRDASSQTA